MPTLDEIFAALGPKQSAVVNNLASPEEGVDVNPSFHTPLTPIEEPQFQNWVKQNKVPFDPGPQNDYDMRGFWLALKSGDPEAKTAVSPFDGKLHFPDTFKTPYHRTFSNESIYANSDAPHWEGDRLIDKNGNVVADETPKKKQN